MKHKLPIIERKNQYFLANEYLNFEANNLAEMVINKTRFDHSYLRNMPADHQLIRQCLNRNLFFVTFQFREPAGQYTSRSHAQLYELAETGYTRICRSIISRAFERNSHLLPLLSIYFDSAGSRSSRKCHDIAVPHFHGLLLTNPKTTKSFEGWLSANGKEGDHNGRRCVKVTRALQPLDSFTVSAFSGDIEALQRLAKYVTKFSANDRYVNPYGDTYDLTRIYPELTPRDYPFYRI